MKLFTKYFYIVIIVFCFNFSMLTPLQLKGQWSKDFLKNNPVVVDNDHNQTSLQMVSDERGGALIGYHQHTPSTNDYNVYVQRIDSIGNIRWGSGGVAVCTHPAYQSSPKVSSDGKGGILVTWFDSRNSKNEILVQRVDSAGNLKWQSDGVAVGTTPEHFQQGDAVVISDGNGGAFIAWVDWRGTLYNPDFTMRIQWINSAGEIQWGPGGIALNKLNKGALQATQMIADGQGGAIITWDQWDGTLQDGNRNIYAQKVNSDGTLAWGENAVTICSQVGEQRFPKLTDDGNGGAIIIWEDYRNGNKAHLFAQKINAAGNIQWTGDGIPTITPPSRSQINYKILSNRNGGAYIGYQFSGGGVVIQMIDQDGNWKWGDMGMSPCGFCDSSNPDISLDDESGFLIVWNTSMLDVQAQRIDGEGNLQWAEKGVWVSYADGNQIAPLVVADGRGGANIVWADTRNGSMGSDVYAQHVTALGALGNYPHTNIVNAEIAVNSLGQNYPNPISDATTIDYRIITPTHVTLNVIDAYGRVVEVLVDEDKSPGDYSVGFNTASLSPGIYHYSLISGGNIISKTMIITK